jgi:hypothetical protein
MPSRRTVLTALAAAPLALSPLGARGDEIIDLDWDDLIPESDAGTLLKSLRPMGVIRHGELTTGFDQEEARAVTDSYTGKIVRLPGFVTPLDFTADGVTAFILAPFVGACIHVPPPPANQLVLVTTTEPYAYEGLFDPVLVTGLFRTAAIGTELAEIGYALSADRVEPFLL